ncbi:hypothetical protein NA66_1001855 [Burkholderia pyrrocinia]|uniref:Uncharacterized protein n=1 Tax=Burkholderia pyrrocinia TaxID=60550 RepID=A0A318J0X0_BURPY|nr:hypothetical protein NA66_1001855 [Burkholderia pyrrocinia]SFW82306.1 hypothetical protein SAMN03159384_05559 [Burkholderia sp. NFACC33-1]SFY44044.1 hypothetical protein SAMN03159408_05721 [Burkholderia sp. NFPP32]
MRWSWEAAHKRCKCNRVLRRAVFAALRVRFWGGEVGGRCDASVAIDAIPIARPEFAWLAAALAYVLGAGYSDLHLRSNTRLHIWGAQLSIEENNLEFATDLCDVGAQGKRGVGGAAVQESSIHLGDLLRKLELLSPQSAKLDFNVARQRFNDWVPANAALNTKMRDVRKVRLRMVHRAEKKREARKQFTLATVRHPQAGLRVQFGVHGFNRLHQPTYRRRVFDWSCATQCSRSSHQEFSGIIALPEDEHILRVSDCENEVCGRRVRRVTLTINGTAAYERTAGSIASAV